MPTTAYHQNYYYRMPRDQDRGDGRLVITQMSWAVVKNIPFRRGHREDSSLVLILDCHALFLERLFLVLHLHLIRRLVELGLRRRGCVDLVLDVGRGRTRWSRALWLLLAVEIRRADCWIRFGGVGRLNRRCGSGRAEGVVFRIESARHRNGRPGMTRGTILACGYSSCGLWLILFPWQEVVVVVVVAAAAAAAVAEEQEGEVEEMVGMGFVDSAGSNLTDSRTVFEGHPDVNLNRGLPGSCKPVDGHTDYSSRRMVAASFQSPVPSHLASATCLHE
jgi:hypothetical protein